MRPEKSELALRMRKNPTPAEQHIWALLRCRRTGEKWRRQTPMLGYIADFYCARLKMILELDGSSHKNRAEYDATRDAAFRRLGFQVVRISNAKAMTLNVDTLRSTLRISSD